MAILLCGYVAMLCNYIDTIWELFLYHFEIIFDYCSIILVPIGEHFVIILGSFWDRFGIILGLRFDHSGINLGSFWVHLGNFCNILGAIWG